MKHLGFLGLLCNEPTLPAILNTLWTSTLGFRAILEGVFLVSLCGGRNVSSKIIEGSVEQFHYSTWSLLFPVPLVASFNSMRLDLSDSLWFGSRF